MNDAIRTAQAELYEAELELIAADAAHVQTGAWREKAMAKRDKAAQMVARLTAQAKQEAA